MSRFQRFSLAGLFAVSLAGWAGAGYGQNVTTQQYDATRAGVQSQETVLTPANVNTATFGKVLSFPVAGHVYAQPLYMSGLTMGDGTVHNVLFVATEQDKVYAFDADGKNPAQGYLWVQTLLAAGETYVSHNDVNSGDIYPDIGITSTPVIDPVTGTIYVLAKSKSATGALQISQKIHALSLVDGSEKFNGPTALTATVPGTGDGGTTVTFSPLLGNQRTGLVLAATPNGPSAASVFIAEASHGDNGPYHGWVFSYNAANLSQQTGVWNATPNGLAGGIWEAGGGLSTDGKGHVFAAVGNGTFDVNTGGSDYGDSVVALTLTSAGLAPSSYFTPASQSNLDLHDQDVSTGSVVLLPPQTGAVANLAVTSDKSGTLFLMNRDALGGFSAAKDASLQSLSVGYSILSSVAFYNNTLYVAGEGGPLAAWPFNPGTQQFANSATTSTAITFGCQDCGGAGTTPSFSANGTEDVILWALDNSGRESTPAILHAYDPSNLQHEFWNSAQAANKRDAAAIAVKFTTPMIANGRVYVGGINAVTAYGQLNPTAAAVSMSATPSTVAAGGSSTLGVTAVNVTGVRVTGTDGSSYTLTSTGGKQVVTPAATTTYTATGTGTNGTATATATVTVSTPATGCLPAAAGVLICTPGNQSTVGSPVTVTAGAIAQSGNISAIRGYLDSVAVFTVNNPGKTKSFQVTQTITASAGGHGLTVIGYQSSGGSVQSNNGFTVGTSTGPSGCAAPTAAGAVICSPRAGATASSPVQISAAARASVGDLVAMRVYVDNISQTTITNPGKTTTFAISPMLTLAKGSHRVTVVGYQSTGGGAQTATEMITVQ